MTVNCFEKNLEVGEQFEVSVALPWLLDNFRDYWIAQTHDFRTGFYAGPKLKKAGCRDLTLPDFSLTKDDFSHRLLVEAKYKDKPFTIRQYPGRKFVAIEEYRMLQYQEAARVLSADLTILVGCGSSRSIHLCNTWVPHVFNNQFYSGPVCAFDITNNAIGTF